MLIQVQINIRWFHDLRRNQWEEENKKQTIGIMDILAPTCLIVYIVVRRKVTTYSMGI